MHVHCENRSLIQSLTLMRLAIMCKHKYIVACEIMLCFRTNFHYCATNELGIRNHANFGGHKKSLCSVYLQSLHIFEFAVKLCLKLTYGKALLTLSFLIRTIVSPKSIRAHYHMSTSRSSIVALEQYSSIFYFKPLFLELWTIRATAIGIPITEVNRRAMTAVQKHQLTRGKEINIIHSCIMYLISKLFVRLIFAFHFIF